MNRQHRVPRCAKCRALGLTSDCTDLILHVHKGVAVSSEDDEMELEVTISFLTPVTSTLHLDPREMAIHMRERWVEDPKLLAEIVTWAINDDYDLEVKPVFT